jgi:hypothetical protein
MTPLGNVAHGYPFLRAIGYQCGGIGIDNRAVEKIQTAEKFRPQFVVSGL